MRINFQINIWFHVPYTHLSQVQSALLYRLCCCGLCCCCCRFCGDCCSLFVSLSRSLAGWLGCLATFISMDAVVPKYVRICGCWVHKHTAFLESICNSYTCISIYPNGTQFITLFYLIFEHQLVQSKCIPCHSTFLPFCINCSWLLWLLWPRHRLCHRRCFAIVCFFAVVLPFIYLFCVFAYVYGRFQTVDNTNEMKWNEMKKAK